MLHVTKFSVPALQFPWREAACRAHLSPVMLHRHLVFTGFRFKTLASCYTPSHVEGFVAHARSVQVCAHDCIVSVAWHIDTNSSDEFQSLWIVTVVSAKEAGLELRLNQLAARMPWPFQAAPSWMVEFAA